MNVWPVTDHTQYSDRHECCVSTQDGATKEEGIENSVSGTPQ